MSGNPFVFNIAKGRSQQLAITDATKFGMILLQDTLESDALMKDRDTLADVVANSDECDATDYARKTGLTATRTLDDSNDRAQLSIPQQTFAGLGGATNNVISKAVIYYEVSASDAGRVPIVAVPIAEIETNNTDFVVKQTSGYFIRAT